MPGWQPNWADVRFDHAAAQAAVDELERAAAVLADQRTRRRHLADAARAEWRGRHRQTFDAEHRHLLIVSRRLEDDLRAAARAVAAAAEQARAEQRRREEARETWRREQAAEQAAAVAP